ncbi:MAG TPA: hypothetical protein VMR86_01265 [Myxococcota bacterium]|nr:hypothetical protein [Myxococcota bacterium]
MKRILATVAALGALGYTSLASAALLTFDVSGPNGSVNSISPYAADPTLPPGTTGVSEFGPFFIAPFDPNSTVTVNTDLNGNGIIGEANDVGLVGGTLNIHAVTPIGQLGTVVADVVATVALGGVGTLSGDQILWNMTGAPGTGTIWLPTGTWYCTGVGLCGLLGLDEGVPLPIATLSAVTGTSPVLPSLLGIWQLNAAHDAITGSTRNTIQTGGATPPPGLGLPAQWYSFGSTDMGHLPEPGAFALVLLGIGGLALRSRKA